MTPESSWSTSFFFAPLTALTFPAGGTQPCLFYTCWPTDMKVSLYARIFLCEGLRASAIREGRREGVVFVTTSLTANHLNLIPLPFSYCTAKVLQIHRIESESGYFSFEVKNRKLRSKKANLLIFVYSVLLRAHNCYSSINIHWRFLGVGRKDG